MLLVATSVMSLPARLMSATPNGMVYSSLGTGPLSWYIILSSKKTTGLSSRMARLEQALGVVRRGGHDNFQAGNMAEPGVQALAMLRGRAARRAQRRAQDHRHFKLAAGHVVNLRRLVDHLIHRQRDEIAEHDVDDRPHAGHRRADADAG